MDKKKEIHLFLYHIDLGGVEKSAVNFANELSTLGHNVYLHPIYKCRTDKFWINPNVKVCPYLRFYFKGLDKIVKIIPPAFLYKSIMKQFRNKGVDIEIAFQADLPAKVVASSNRDSKKFVWIHGIGMKYKPFYEKFDKMVFVGKDIQNHYLKTLPKISSAVLYNPIETDLIRQLSQEKITDEINMDKFTFITIGRLSQEKCFDKLIVAFRKLIDEFELVDEVQLLIVGSGKEKEYLESIVEELNLKGKVIFLGFKKNPYKYLGKSDVYVCSSEYEGFNIAVTEAAALGIPVVSTKVYGANEFLGHKDEYGVVVDDKEEGLVSGMGSMLDAVTRDNYSEAIKSRFTEFYENNRTMDIKKILDM